MVTDPTRMCELLVGLPEVTVLGLEDEVGAPLSIHVETRARRPGCSECGVLARVKDRPLVTLVDLAASRSKLCGEELPVNMSARRLKSSDRHGPPGLSCHESCGPVESLEQ